MPSAGFDNDFKEQVRAATNIVGLIGESLALTPGRGGREYKGICPFHNDTNPSLTVSPERQSYKCWSCGEGGDCFSWTMWREGVEFREALRLLAERAGLEMPAYFNKANAENRDAKQTLLEVLAWAESEFHRYLLSAKDAEVARVYLAERGFSDETIRKYKLGFHPPEWEWLLNRARGKYTPQQLVTAWLAGERNSGNGYYDNFFGRVMFPVRDERGRPVAFGGRVLPSLARENDAKYINSADTPLFSKSRLLYGLDVAREAVRKADEAVVVEGYTDCIMCAQAGIENAVAILGTALTEQHVQLLRRFCRKVVLVLDGDAAGQNAAVRSLGKFLAQDVDLRILPLPAGSDPADYLTDHGADAFRELSNTAVEAWEFKLQSSINTHSLESIDSRHRVLTEMLELLAEAPQLAGTVRNDLILSRLSRRLDVSEEKIRKELQATRQRANQNANQTVSYQNEEPTYEQTTRPVRTPDDRLESELLQMIFADANIVGRVLERVSVEEFRHPELQHVFGICRDLWEQEVPPSYERVMTVLESPSLKRLATEIEDLSRRKQIAEKLQTAPLTTGVAPPPSYFDDVVARFEHRRRQQESAAVPQPHSPFTGLTAELKAQLRDLSELRNADPQHHRTKPRTGRQQ